MIDLQAADRVYVGQGDAPVTLLMKYANRHGLIAGATGTGKTVSLQVLAEGFASRGVPVFLADVKGDLSGMCQPGGGNPKLEARAEQIGMGPIPYAGFPVMFWDVFGQNGHPIRSTISEMGPLLLARLLDLNEIQEGVLNLTFKLADDNGMLLLDLKDLQAMLAYVAEHAKEITTLYGNVSPATIGAIQRALLVLEQQGAEEFFGEPALDLRDFMRTSFDGRGFVNILAADKLFQSPRLYATFLLWLLAELFEELPEAGDLDKPKLVFFFDEAHLLFSDAPKALIDKVEQVVRLIRSKGIGVYFVTQNPMDVPESVLGQLGNRIQHGLRAFTPKDQKDVRATAENFRANSKFDTEEVILQLGTGEALISVLDEKGIPTVVERTLVRPPASRLGPASADERRTAMGGSPVSGKYDQATDRESAFEVLRTKADAAAREAELEEQREAEQKAYELQMKEQERLAREQARMERAEQRRTGSTRRSDTMMESMAKSVLRSAGSQIGRQIVRGILGGIFKGR